MTDHDWQALVRFPLTETEARGIAAAEAEDRELEVPLDLTQERAVGVSTGCWVCEQVLSLALVGEPCPGGPK